MLMYCDYSKPIYILGTGMSAQDLQEQIKITEPGVKEVTCVDYKDFHLLKNNEQAIVGFMNHRDTLKELIDSLNVCWISFIHPTTYVAKTVSIGRGTSIWPMSCIQYKVSIGEHCMIQSNTMIGHNVSIGDRSVICADCAVAGSTTIGKDCHIWQSVTIRDRVSITDSVQCLMSSVVTKDIDTPGRYKFKPFERN
jgi:acetyltransferase-like isoleucine patch superfamily enzyme